MPAAFCAPKWHKNKAYTCGRIPCFYVRVILWIRPPGRCRFPAPPGRTDRICGIFFYLLRKGAVVRHGIVHTINLTDFVAAAGHIQIAVVLADMLRINKGLGVLAADAQVYLHILAGVANHRILAGTNAPKILLLQRQVLHRGVVVLEHTVPFQRALSVKNKPASPLG